MTDERKAVKEMLDRNSLTQVWLINRLADVGINTDKAELSSALNGARKGAKVETVIAKACEILQAYESAMKQAFGQAGKVS